MISKLAIIILNWNGVELLKTYLPNVLEYSQAHRIYVIDNYSSDDSVSYIQKNHPEVQIIENKENFGFAKGYNEGLKSIEAEIYCLLNNDVRVTPNWTMPVLNLFDNNSKIAAIQPKILDLKKPEYFEYAGAAGGFLDNLGYPYCRGRIFWDLEKDDGQYDDETEIFWATGACLFIRAQDFWDTGGFDPDFFAHQEEIDLCWRLNNRGKKIYYCGHSKVYHLGGATLSAGSSFKTYLNIRNSLFMLLKNLPKEKILPVIYQRLLFDLISALYFSLKNGPEQFSSVIKGHWQFFQSFQKFYAKRTHETQSLFKPKTYYLPVKYFILNLNKFKDLS